jgi:hypothetical protein
VLEGFFGGGGGWWPHTPPPPPNPAKITLLKLFKITGRSLHPDLQDGDVVVALTWRRLWRLRPGERLLFRQPGYGLMVKKLARILPDGGLFVVGVSPTSIDSYEFGPVSPAQVVGVVLRVFRAR